MFGVVAIGRNEGARLRRCLGSLPASVARVAYVDSGSTDGSVQLARRMGADVVELDPFTPFTAARARNAGITRLLERGAPLEFVLVVDGDCELTPGFLEAAVEEMSVRPRVAVVCGRRRERHRGATIYNTLCDLEWDTPIGDADACGGDALLRVGAFREVGGYDPELVAGEEPELCLRLRRSGWSVRRIDEDMTVHDAAIDSFGAWWKRAVRAGHAYAELFDRHGYWGRELASAAVYAIVVPAFAMALLPFSVAACLVVLSAYVWLFFRVRIHRLDRGDGPADAALYARFCVVAKFAHVAGMARYAARRLRGARSEIIEYKTPVRTPEKAAGAWPAPERR